MSDQFKKRLDPMLPEIADHFGTPFHIYDEAGIFDTGERLKRAFSGIDNFREYFAVKALPNPSILKIIQKMGFGFDCSSIPELQLCRHIGARGEDILFSSNNTTPAEFSAALADGGCILNLDDISLVPKVPDFPEMISFRYNPGEKRTGNTIIGIPAEAKYGVAHDQLIPAYAKAMERGAKRFGIHAMMASNELAHSYMVDTAQMLLNAAARIGNALKIRFESINIGGGFGIPYTPDDQPLDLETMATEMIGRFASFREQNDYIPTLAMESGRYMTGPHGVLVTRVINRKEIYRTHIGVDASMSALMRPGIYGAYHHITKQGEDMDTATQIVDVVGSLCENNDKFAVQRTLPVLNENDLIYIHDTGAHGHAMGFTYNGRLRPKELLLGVDGSVELIRREETAEDYFSTLRYTPDVLLTDADRCSLAN